MAQEPDSMVPRMLQEIQETLREVHDKVFDHDRRFDAIEKRLDEWQETTATSLGLAAHANIRNQHIEEELADLKRRIERLEQTH